LFYFILAFGFFLSVEPANYPTHTPTPLHVSHFYRHTPRFKRLENHTETRGKKGFTRGLAFG